LKGEVESKAKATYNVFKAVQYRSQVVAGTNYFIKVETENGAHIHIKVFKPLPKDPNPNPQLSAVQTGKTLGDIIEYF
jgi:cystatin-A/B